MGDDTPGVENRSGIYQIHAESCLPVEDCKIFMVVIKAGAEGRISAGAADGQSDWNRGSVCFCGRGSKAKSALPLCSFPCNSVSTFKN